MFRPRSIPVLLLKDNALVKSRQFKNFRYIGDPINAVRIFNDFRADELVILDTDATREQRLVSLNLVKDIGEEANMPFAVGGGIRTLEHIRDVIGAGAEKVVIGTAAAEQPGFIREASASFGSSTIVVCMDVKKPLFGAQQVFVRNGGKSTSKTPETFAKEMEQEGAGELIVQSIDNDGMMHGYDVQLVRRISESVSVPVVALGGAGQMNDLRLAFTEGKANGLAAGSFFVFHGPQKGVLITYPAPRDLVR
jgi:imidazole glycerol-phosphate synthase subunit HisF